MPQGAGPPGALPALLSLGQGLLERSYNVLGEWKIMTHRDKLGELKVCDNRESRSRPIVT